MNERQLTWNVGEQKDLFAREWKPNQCNALICLVHGHAEHVDRYQHVAQFFANKGIATLAMDLPGHGKSYGKRGHISNYNVYLEHTELLLQKGAECFPGIPIFLYGHSMGGNIVINYMLRKQPNIAGAITTSPWLKLYTEASKVQQAMAKVMRKIYPGLVQKTGLDAKLLSHDAEIVNKYVTDPMVHGLMSIELYLSMEEAAQWALSNAKEQLKKPLLVLHSTADQITDAKGSAEFKRKAGFLVDYRQLDDSFHELHNEPNYAEVLSLIFNWITTIKDE